MEDTVEKLKIKAIKEEFKNEKESIYNNTMEHLKTKMSKKSKQFLELSTEVGVSNWLSTHCSVWF